MQSIWYAGSNDLFYFYFSNNETKLVGRQLIVVQQNWRILNQVWAPHVGGLVFESLSKLLAVRISVLIKVDVSSDQSPVTGLSWSQVAWQRSSEILQCALHPMIILWDIAVGRLLSHPISNTNVTSKASKGQWWKFELSNTSATSKAKWWNYLKLLTESLVLYPISYIL